MRFTYFFVRFFLENFAIFCLPGAKKVDFQAKMGKNDQNFPRNHDFSGIPPKNGHKMGTRYSFSMKYSGKCSSEPKENTFKQVFCLQSGWVPPNFGFLRPRTAILGQILVIFGHFWSPKKSWFWPRAGQKTQKIRKNPAKKVYKPYCHWKEACPSVIFLH